jgi:ribosomal protein S17E
MTDESKSPSPAPVQEPTPVPLLSPAISTGQQQPDFGFYKVVGEAAKYSVFAVFVLYSIGFIIWHSYLGSYGVSSVVFLQAEYLAAAFCYLFILATFAVPPVLLTKALFGNIKKKGLYGVAGWDKNWLFVVSLWFFLSSRITNVFLPGSYNLTNKGQKAEVAFFALMVLHIILFFICAVKAGYWNFFMYGNNWKETEAARNWKTSMFFRLIVRSEYFGLYTLALLLITLIFNPQIDGGFLFFTIFLYATATIGVSSNFIETWKTSDLIIRALIIVFICITLVSNIQLFAVNQFGKIPKSVGGGKAETAYIKLSPQNSDVAASLNIPTATSAGLPNGFVGPIGVLLRSDKEILFVNYADVYSPDYVTNDLIVSIVTNIISSQITNQIVGKVGKHETNISNQFTVTLKTNVVYNVAKNILKAPAKLTARQIRSDLIESIIFTR